MAERNAVSSQKLNITFSGCGFLGIYHVGVASALKDRAPRLLEKIESFGGASAGALAAGSLLCGIDLAESLDFTLRLAERAHKLSVGPFHPRFRLTKTIRKVFTNMIPKDAYKICSGKLHISLTRCSDWQNVVVSEFNSNDDLVDALVASAHVPFYSGIMPPKFRGVCHVDGGISNNLPQHFDGETITVTPWSGESDICPQDESNSFNHIMFANTSIRFTAHNFYRLCRAFFPPDADALGKMCKQGYKDTVRYLETHYPEYLIENVENERKVSCSCSISSDPPNMELEVATDIVDTKPVFEEVPLSPNQLDEQCGECRLHSMLEIKKADVMIAEKEYWSCYVLRILFNVLVKPCVLTVMKITELTEMVILKLPKVYTGVDFVDLLLHTINEAIAHYEIYQNIHTCTDSCSHEHEVYRSNQKQTESSSHTLKIKAHSEAAVLGEETRIISSKTIDEDGYDTACSSGSSYTTCRSSYCSDDMFDTYSSSSCDTVIDDLCCAENEGHPFVLVPDQVRSCSALEENIQWDTAAIETC